MSDADLIIARLADIPVFCVGREYVKEQCRALFIDGLRYTFYINNYTAHVYPKFSGHYDIFVSSPYPIYKTTIAISKPVWYIESTLFKLENM